jgi:hypothetical protein
MPDKLTFLRKILVFLIPRPKSKPLLATGNSRLNNPLTVRRVTVHGLVLVATTYLMLGLAEINFTRSSAGLWNTQNYLILGVFVVASLYWILAFPVIDSPEFRSHYYLIDEATGRRHRLRGASTSARSMAGSEGRGRS